jgi:hypothetical protein
MDSRDFVEFDSRDDKPLNERMDFEHIIKVDESGNITDAEIDAYFDLHVILTDPDKWEWVDEFTIPEGWNLLNGFSGQYGYSGPVMHPSEYVGGRLEAHIRETPGYYVCLVVESDCQYTQEFCSEESGCDCEPAGWAIAYKPLDD